jgi:hypothetical protein
LTVDWDYRAPEEQALFNPALLGTMIRSFTDGFEDEGDEPAPFVLIFAGLPMILHPKTRTALPRTVATSFLSWIGQHPLERARFPHLASSLAGRIREACLFALTTRLIEIDEHGGLHAAPLTRSEYNPTWPSPEIDEMHRRARFVGRWFARSGSTTTILASLGVKP